MADGELGEKRTVARGSSFTTPEDEPLTKAWIGISEDAIVGSDQKRDVFFKAFNDYYESIKPAYCLKRKNKLVERRLRNFLAECLGFAGCFAKATNARPSGTKNDEVLYLATALLNKFHITLVSESCEPPLKFVSCWRLLKDQPKFDLILSTPAPPTDTSRKQDEDEDEINEKVEVEEFKRPIGHNRAKAIGSRA